MDGTQAFLNELVKLAEESKVQTFYASMQSKDEPIAFGGLHLPEEEHEEVIQSLGKNLPVIGNISTSLDALIEDGVSLAWYEKDGKKWTLIYAKGLIPVNYLAALMDELRALFNLE